LLGDAEAQARATLGKRPPDGLGLGLACALGDLCGESLDLGVLDVEGYRNTRD
jgi:hypothetical protein